MNVEKYNANYGLASTPEIIRGFYPPSRTAHLLKSNAIVTVLTKKAAKFIVFFTLLVRFLIIIIVIIEITNKVHADKRVDL